MPHRNGMVATLLDALQNQVSLHLACSKCSQQENESTYLLKEVDHNCMKEILLARCKGAKGCQWRKVDRRPSFPNPACYDVCRYYVAGLGCTKHHNTCTFAWSQEEVIVWTFERKYNIERRVLKWLLKQSQSGIENTTAQPTPADLSNPEDILSEFGGYFQEICGPCFNSRPQRICPRGSSHDCKNHLGFILVHVITAGKKKQQYTEIRPCPESHRLFSYCSSILAGRSCRNASQSCSFAHSDVELAIWKAEQRRGLDRAKLLRPAAEPATVSPPDSAPQYQFYCRVCLVTCDSQQSFENHCLSVEHTELIATDTLTEWSYRAPPYDPKSFALCQRPDVCEYGQDCALAHSVQELEEWIQRAKTAEKKKKTAKEDGLLAYQDRLIAEYQTSHNEVLIISEAVEGVRVTCQQPLRIQSENKKLQYQWVFAVHSQKPLIHVALLKRAPGAIFHLAVPGQTPLLTYASGKSFKTIRASPPAIEVKVCMKSRTFGIYEQWVVFDFGSRPVLVQKLHVRVGQKEAAWRVNPANESGSCFVQSGRWHTGNRVVVPSMDRTSKKVELVAKYKAPSLSMDFQRGTRGKPITRVNYCEEMHNFLFREEEAQQLLISKLNLHAVVSFVKCVEVFPSGMKFALPGQLYAQVPTPYSLTMDSDEGYLLQRSVRTAFLARDPPANNRVYEVSIEIEAITEKSICLFLPQRCCMELGLQPDTRAKMEVQFQTDQLQFCQWHQAVDNLWDVKLVFPDVTNCSIPRGSLQVPWGNAKQKQALAFITGQVTEARRTPPLLIYGPFGTGKTFTLAKTTLEIIKKPQTRVLICTHTNSAADIYIREYFHNYVISSHPEAVPLRVKSIYRSVKTTDHITLRYCCLSQSGEQFCLPTREYIDKHRIVLTTCMISGDLGLPPGYFTHILIDEAAQMLECEALVPLSLATLRTLIVLAGDHMQKTPRFYSLHKDEQSADYTLLNRLFQNYKKEQHEVATKSRIIFNENYRSTAGIIEFVSKHFYVGREDTISAKGNIPPHPEFYPLMFCHVSGSVEKDRSMSWYNLSEIEQIIEKVEEMSQKWPAEWGEKDLKSICVVSSGIQVKFIRDRLRKRGFSEVTVENDDNLPGKEFRVVIINTVHTCNSVNHVSSSNLEYFNNARVLNTIITRAQSQVIVVGDAVALCSYGQCSKIWKSFIKKCIEKKSIIPENLTLEEIKQMVSDWTSWNRGNSECEEESSDTDSWVSDTESLNLDDPILQELLDESKEMMVTVTKEGLLKVKSNVSVPESRRQEYVNYSSQTMQQYLQMQPHRYKRCGFIQERFDQASAFTLDEAPSVTIQIKGRLNCGMAFTGDQVLVEILTPNATTFEGNLRGKVVGILKEVERDLTFVCRVDEFDLRVMIPIDQSVTKIFVPPLRPDADRDAIPVRKIDQAGNIKLKGWKKITPENRKTCLFVVQIVKWREGYYYPMGIVTEVLPVASSLEDGLRILELEYCLSNGYPASVTSQVTKLISRHPSLMKEERKDCRAHCTFTIDPLSAKDLDDAISVRDMGDKYEIGIHIADVASVISKDCPLDTEAKKRGLTYYVPEKEPVHMLPSQLSQNLFSLLPHKERSVISLFVVLDKATDHMERISFAMSVICSDRQMTYEEAEGIIKNHYKIEAPSPHFDTLEDCVAMAYHFSRVHRKSRLREDCHYDQLDEEIPLGQRCSHQMIEEFMVLFNSSVGDLLTNRAPTRNLTPLRCQMEPNPLQISQMQDKYREIIPLSTHLSHHLGVPTGDVSVRTSQPFVLLTSSWEHLKSAANDRDFAKMLDLITTDDIHPKLAPINLEFWKLLSRSYFLRSNSCPQSKMGHYSLHVDSYTWASSPIRRYMDVVVQRHIISLISKKPVQYSQPEIEFICHDFNRKNSRANMYERRVQSLELATQLKCQVQKKFAFIANIEEKAKNFKLMFPLNKGSFPDSPCISYRALQLVSQPNFIEEQNSMKLTWRRRVYSLVTKRGDNEKRSEIGGNVFHFSGDVWHEILAVVKNEDYEKLIHLLVKNYTLEPKRAGLVVRRSKCSHYKEVSVELKVGDVLNFQLTTNVQQGFLVPFVQLWTVTPGFEVCLEHTERPIDCFSKYTSQAPKNIYKDASDYRKVWLPLCDIEATLGALAENNSIVLQDVPILWKKQRTKKGQLCGTIKLNKKFLKECAIDMDFGACYMCIRLSGLQGHGFQDQEVDLSQTFQQLTLSKETTKTGGFTIDLDTYTWVAHGCTDTFEENEKPDERGEVMVNFYIHFTSMEKIPFEVTQKSSRFSVELIPKQLPDVRKEKAVWSLEYASTLAQAIALGQPIPTQKARPSKILKKRNFDIPGSSRRLNPSQQNAIWEALQKPFTLIQGPPGTGKTVVGAHIVYWFHQLNHEETGNSTQPGAMPPMGNAGDASTAKSHILYCGPSHKSVDVVAEMLMGMTGSLRPLRVYGETIETMDFPYPGSNLQISGKAQRNTKSKPELRPITLHYLIRGKSNPYSGRILAFDERVKRGEEITEEEIDRYKRLLNKARGYEVERHDIVLCTCSASSSKFLGEKLHVKQVLIDECAMCTEPETLIPLAKYRKIEKVVLLGDHKQLRPVVHSDFCKKLGMERSLFERYHKQAGMLNIQYRMHRDICCFPSAAFYNNKLMTCPNIVRGSSTLYHHSEYACTPIIFGHVEGRERSLMVSTEEGNENSKANLEEVQHVVRIAKQLTLDRTTTPDQIAILTGYNAQVMEIKKQLALDGVPDVNVCTIMKSQGSEWKYVLVSTVRSCNRQEIDQRPTKSWLSKHLGFVGDPNQINVCLTRAQEGLCIVGNSHLLESHCLWRELLDHYRFHGCFTLAGEIRIKKRTSLRL